MSCENAVGKKQPAVGKVSNAAIIIRFIFMLFILNIFSFGVCRIKLFSLLHILVRHRAVRFNLYRAWFARLTMARGKGFPLPSLTLVPRSLLQAKEDALHSKQFTLSTKHSLFSKLFRPSAISLPIYIRTRPYSSIHPGIFHPSRYSDRWFQKLFHPNGRRSRIAGP